MNTAIKNYIKRTFILTRVMMQQQHLQAIIQSDAPKNFKKLKIKEFKGVLNILEFGRKKVKQ